SAPRRRSSPRACRPADMSETAQRILVADPLGLADPSFAPVLKTYPDVAFEDWRSLTPELLRDKLAEGFDGLNVRSGTKVKAALLDRAGSRLRVIGRAGIGVDNIDVEEATKRGIVVMNTPGGSNVTTAEHAIAMMLALARNVPQAAAAVRGGAWPRE